MSKMNGYYKDQELIPVDREIKIRAIYREKASLKVKLEKLDSEYTKIYGQAAMLREENEILKEENEILKHNNRLLTKSNDFYGDEENMADFLEYLTVCEAIDSEPCTKKWFSLARETKQQLKEVK